LCLTVVGCPGAGAGERKIFDKVPSCQPHAEGRRSGAINVFQDINELKQAEQELRKAKDDLAKANEELDRQVRKCTAEGNRMI
jgi:signal transduction histidine kinase